MQATQAKFKPGDIVHSVYSDEVSLEVISECNLDQFGNRKYLCKHLNPCLNYFAFLIHEDRLKSITPKGES